MIVRFAKIFAVVTAVLVVFGASAYFTLTYLIRSEDTVVVPDLVGDDVVDVLTKLSDLGLNTKVETSQFSETVPENCVVFQNPPPGTKIKADRDVRIVISKGAGTVSMPNLAGLSFQQAALILEDNGLCQGRRSHTPDPTAEKDHIIAQVPDAGTLIDRGVCIDLLVSTGRRLKTYQMPDLNRLTMNEAIAAIERRHLVLGQIKSFYRQDKTRHTVIGQEPSAGHRVTEGIAVHLVINRVPGKDDRITSGTDGLIRHRVKEGFLRSRIRVHMDGYGLSGDIFDAYVKPGEEIWIMTPNLDKATVRVYENEQLVLSKVYE